MTNPEIPGILIERATSLLTEQFCGGPWSEWDGDVFTDPVWIPGDTIDQLIQGEHWKAGHLDNVRCTPDVSEWPDRWKGLKTR